MKRFFVIAAAAIWLSLSAAGRADERDRLWRVERQLAIQNHIRWLNGFPPAGGLESPDPNWSGPAGRWDLGRWPDPFIAFEPWPIVPGEIYGYAYVPPSRQPSGHRLTPLGQNAYRYDPVYADVPVADSPRAATPEELPPPRPIRRRGPREF